MAEPGGNWWTLVIAFTQSLAILFLCGLNGFWVVGAIFSLIALAVMLIALAVFRE